MPKCSKFEILSKIERKELNIDQSIKGFELPSQKNSKLSHAYVPLGLFL
jgi:hypothetical protein